MAYKLGTYSYWLISRHSVRSNARPLAVLKENTCLPAWY